MSQDMSRTKMTDEQAEKFLSKYIADRGLSAQAANKHIRLVAAKRLAALDRYTSEHAAPAGKAKPAKKGAKAPAKKAAKKAAGKSKLDA